MIAPLVKWAGGKRQLRAELEKRLPAQWNTYYEPFVGGGALLVSLLNQNRISKAVISDLNSELINLYRVVREYPEGLVSALSDEGFRNDADAFTEIKYRFNQMTGHPGNEISRAAYLLYLNRHGYNGLWRVNRDGKFNVPFGRYTHRSLPSAVSLSGFGRLLADVTILDMDFEDAVETAEKGDFIYFDPPYHPVSKTARFTGYNMNGFDFDDQKRLARVYRKLSGKGVLLMLSNSRAPEIEDLYRGFFIEPVPAKRFINCNGKRRTGAMEIIVTNYKSPM